MAIKFSSATQSRIVYSDNNALTLPNSDWSIFTLIKVNSSTKFQYVFSTGNVNTANTYNLVFNSTAPADYGKLLVYLHTLGTSGLVLKSTNTFSSASGWFGVLIRRSANTLTLSTCPVLSSDPTDGSAVILQATFGSALSLAFNPTAGLYLGSRSDLNIDRFYDNECHRFLKIDSAISDLQFAKLCYGYPPSEISLTPSFYLRLNSITDINDQQSILATPTTSGTLTDTANPLFGYDAAQSNSIAITGGYQNNRIYVVSSISQTTYNIPISGTWAGQIPSKIEYKVVDLDDIELQTWADASATINGGGTWTASVPVDCIGGLKKIQVRSFNGLTLMNTSAIRSEIFGIGLYFILIGSSSSVYLVENYNTAPLDDAKYLKYYNVGTATWLSVNSTSINPFNAFADYVYSQTGLCTLVTTLGITGSTALEWSTNAQLSMGTAYNANNGLSGVGLTVGSNDAATDTIIDYPTHYQHFLNIIATSRSRTYPTIPIFIHGSAKRSSSTSSALQWDICREVEKDIGNNELNVVYASNPIEKPTRDGIHLTQAAFAEVCTEMLAPNVINFLQGLPILRGCYISHILYKPNTNFVKVFMPVNGAAITPTSGYTGFSATDDSGNLPISTLILENNFIIKITFTRTIVGIPVVKFLSGHNPTTTTLPKTTNGFPPEVGTRVAAIVDAPRRSLKMLCC